MSSLSKIISEHHRKQGEVIVADMSEGDAMAEGLARGKRKAEIDLWAGFLKHEGFEPAAMSDDDLMDIVELCGKLATTAFNGFRSYKDRLKCRKLVVHTAFDMCLDLTSIKHIFRRKAIINRGLLDVWNQQYIIKYGANYGTPGWMEAKRRDIKTKLAQRRKEEKHHENL